MDWTWGHCASHMLGDQRSHTAEEGSWGRDHTPGGWPGNLHLWDCFGHVVRHYSFHTLSLREMRITLSSFYYRIPHKINYWFRKIPTMKPHIEVNINYMNTINKKWQNWHFSFPSYELVDNYTELRTTAICWSLDVVNNKHKNKVNSELELWIINLRVTQAPIG